VGSGTKSGAELMSRIERTNEKYNRAIVKEILRADKMPPEKRTSDIKELLKYLNEDEAHDG
jgi:hypothetical protein